jgi:hypothetical protein
MSSYSVSPRRKYIQRLDAHLLDALTGVIPQERIDGQLSGLVASTNPAQQKMILPCNGSL